MCAGLITIGTASANFVEFRVIRPRASTDNMTLTLHNIMLTSEKHANTITSMIAAKQRVINEVYVFFNKIEKYISLIYSAD